MTDSPSTESNRSSQTLGHEPNQVSIKLMIGACIGVLVMSLLAFVGMAQLFHVYASFGQPPLEIPASLKQVKQQQVEPSLNADQKRNLKEQRAMEESILTSEEWLNGSKTHARIPIDRAMNLLIEKGKPNWSPDEKSTEPPSSKQMNSNK